MGKPFEKKTYFALARDPVHVGTGGYRLGRVDNAIVREPGSNIPKIPGSSIAGVARAYTAMAVQSDVSLEIGADFTIDYTAYKKCKYSRPAFQLKKINGSGKIVVRTDTENNPLYEGENPKKDKYYSCAGKGADDGKGHCGEPDCEVCIPFGFSKPNNSFQGLAQFSDARILFFPVHSMTGPIWITSPSMLAEFGCQKDVKQNKFKAINADYNKSLNFGWLLLERDTPSRVDVHFSFLNTCDACKVIKERVFLVSDKLFSRIINDNLEIRTSVAINPLTGAAEDGALFTYEAIPRGTIMWFDVVYNNPEYFKINGNEPISLGKPDGYRDPLSRAVESDDQLGYMAFYMEQGFAYLDTLGVGGMNTRGMGRLNILNLGRQ